MLEALGYTKEASYWSTISILRDYNVIISLYHRELYLGKTHTHFRHSASALGKDRQVTHQYSHHNCHSQL